MMDWLRRKGGGVRRQPLLKRDILIAQEKTRSAHEAARYLGVHYNTYKKYAKLYGIFEQHKNQSGKGIPKPHVHGTRYPLSEILKGNHPSYDVRKLRKRLINAGVLDEKCAICGFNERRVTDYKMPLILVFKDGNSTHHELENMLLLCFNCAFLTVGELNNINPYKIKNLSAIDDEAVYAEENDIDLEDRELAEILAEAQQELKDEGVIED